MLYCKLCRNDKTCGLKSRLDCHGQRLDLSNPNIKIPERLYVPNDLQNEFAMYLGCTPHFRKIAPSDAGAVGIDVAVIYLSGKKPRWSFKGYARFKADVGKVGKTFADVWLREKVYALPNGMECDLGPCRFSVNAGKCYIFCYR